MEVVGQVCESGDFFALDREMPELHEGDLIAIMSAGAYGFVMASNYNSRPLPAEALVRGDKVALIRKRQTWEDLVRDEAVESLQLQIFVSCINTASSRIQLNASP